MTDSKLPRRAISAAATTAQAQVRQLSAAVAATPFALSSRPEQREFDMTATDFDRIRALIARFAGIVLSPAKQDMVYNRLAGRLRQVGDRSFSQYLDRLERDRAEQERFINALTTNLTSFFREAHHFEILAEQFRSIREARTIRVWCCAASTGEEPYSLAMTACEAFKSLTPPVQIVASDIDTAVLAQGEAGIYRPDRLETLSAERRRQFMVTDGRAQDGAMTVRPELRRLISFRRINLMDSTWPMNGPLDAIFCRNVMIYFDKQTQYAILRRFAPLLRPDGQLFAGHSESFAHASDILRSRGRTVYVRLDSPLS